MKGPLTRRHLLGVGGTAAAALAAGCSGLGGGSADAGTGEGTDEPDPDPNLRVGDRYLSSAFPIEFVEPDFETRTGVARGARLTYIHWHGPEDSHWHQSPLEIATGETRAGRTRFLLDGAEEIPLGPDSEFSQRVEPTDGTPDGLLTVAVDGGRVEIAGNETGTGELRFELLSGGDSLWGSPPLPVEIV
jgi:hypothetical protein